MRPLGHLTWRGAGLVAAGATGCGVAWFAHEAAALWPGLFLALLPLVTLGGLALGPTRLLARRVAPVSEVPVGTPLTLRLTLAGLRRGPRWPLVVTDRLPDLLGGPVTFEVDSPAWDADTQVDYECRPTRRGRYTLTGLGYRYGDPLGLAGREVRPATSTELIVTPRVHPLGPAAPAASFSTGEAATPHLAFSGPDDVLVREYQPRDDVRRIHWPSTARTGTLMVRREEQTWDPSAWVLLDARAAAYSVVTFEWAVELCASVGVALLDAGYDVGLATSGGGVHRSSGREHGNPASDWTRHLVDVAVGGEASLDASAALVDREAVGGLVVAVVGRLGPAEAAVLTRRTSAAERWLLYLPGGSAAAQAERDAVEALRGARWRVAPAPPGHDPRVAWAALQAAGGGRR